MYLTLEKGCNPMVIDYDDHTPLHCAAGNGQLKIVRFLVEALGCRTDIHGHDHIVGVYMRKQCTINVDMWQHA